MERTNVLMIYIHYFILYVIINMVNKISIVTIKGEVAVAIAVVWMIITTVIYFLLLRKKSSKNIIILYSILNALIGGIAVSSYYTLKDVTPFLPILLIFVFGSLMTLNYLLSNALNNRKVLAKFNLLFAILLLFVSFFIWIENNKSLGSSLFFLGVVYLCFSYALHRMIKKGLSWSSIIPLSSLLMFGGLLFVVIVVLTDGDALDVIDAGFLESSGKKKIST